MDAHKTVTQSGIFFTEATTGALRRRGYRLSVIAGPDKGARAELDASTFLIGSHATNTLTLKDAGVSRYHLELSAGANGLQVTDLNSTYGTFHEGTRIGSIAVAGPVKLRLGETTELEIVPFELDVVDEAYQGEAFGRAVGGAPSMRRLFGLLDRVADSDTTVLLEGETGTGKDLLAEGLHARSSRAGKSFVVVDCGSLPRELIGSELFGHVRGAFTGADRDKAGLFAEAHGGTLFLDEIGELPLDLQPQLLRVLEKREARPVGGTRSQKVDVRIVAATHRDLPELVRKGSFRSDLYYRISVVRATVPPLRERREDIPRLLRACLAELGTKDFDLGPDGLAQLMAYDWPGNVRELRNVVERGLALRGELDLPVEAAVGSPTVELERGLDDGDLRPFKEAKARAVDAFEREYLRHVLERHDGNISRAAVAVGLDRGHLRLLIRKHGLADPET